MTTRSHRHVRDELACKPDSVPVHFVTCGDAPKGAVTCTFMRW
jgi:hypothetical protein